MLRSPHQHWAAVRRGPLRHRGGFVGSTRSHRQGLCPTTSSAERLMCCTAGPAMVASFISMRVLRTSALSAGTVLALARGSARQRKLGRSWPGRRSPRPHPVPALPDRDGLFVTAGSVALARSEGVPCRVRRHPARVGRPIPVPHPEGTSPGVPTTPVAVPEHAVRAVDGTISTEPSGW